MSAAPGSGPAPTPPAGGPPDGPSGPRRAAAKPPGPRSSRSGSPRSGSPRATEPDALGPRRAALRLMAAVEEEGMRLSDPRAAAILAPLPEPDRARAQRLAAAAYREAERADRWLAPRLRRGPTPGVRALLRLGLAELSLGEAPHGVVHSLVTLASQHPRTAAAKGLVNAMLRQAGPDWAEGVEPSRMPPWLRKPVADAWGPDTARAIEAAHAAGAPLDLTATRDPAALAGELTGELGGELLPGGTIRLTGAGQVSRLPGYQEGAFWVQDAAAAIPARLLDARPGERVLDLCAAPGGKALQMAAAGAEVTALDASLARLARLRENLARTGLAARIVERDLFEFTESGWDAILLDAPCSATGTLRRHPELPYARSGQGIGELVELQARMVDHALRLLRPGGRLVVATCSLLPAEGEGLLAAALDRHPGWRAAPPEAAESARIGVETDWITPGGGIRTRPDRWADRGGMDGFHIARLVAA